MSDLTPVPEGTPPSAPESQPSPEATESVETLKEKLAAAEKARLEAEQDAKTWKNRVREEHPPKEKKVDTDEAYADWRIDARDRLNVAGVKDAYDQELAELQEGGAKLTVTMREKALALAEMNVGVKKESRPTTEPLPNAIIDRGGQRDPVMTEHDVAFGVKPETKKKYAHIVEG